MIRVSDRKGGGEGIVIFGIYTCDAADHLADRSPERAEDGGA